jgi:NhaP-type Na+/H+ or K+/H+ antiporter
LLGISISFANKSSDWFRVETQDDTLQPTIDLLLNVSFFIWVGAVAPWKQFADNSIMPLYRLVLIGLLVLIFRRLPFVLLIHKKIHQIKEWRQAIFVGFFGPIGVSAVFYLYIAVDFLQNNVRYNDEEREDAKRLSEIIVIVVWFLVICSVVSSFRFQGIQVLNNIAGSWTHYSRRQIGSVSSTYIVSSHQHTIWLGAQRRLIERAQYSDILTAANFTVWK